MSLTDRYRELYDWERDCNDKMLGMIESVPQGSQSDDRFKQAVQLAAHLAACRENWLNRMEGDPKIQIGWWPENFPTESLRPRFAEIEARWTAYLAEMSDHKLLTEFEYPFGVDKRGRWCVEGQILQLIGHACYHRGQIALLVSQLGGEAVETDFLYWKMERDDHYGEIKS